MLITKQEKKKSTILRAMTLFFYVLTSDCQSFFFLLILLICVCPAQDGASGRVCVVPCCFGAGPGCYLIGRSKDPDEKHQQPYVTVVGT